jgi:hypothetical protein
MTWQSYCLTVIHYNNKENDTMKMDEALKQINSDGATITSIFYVSDSSQVCVVFESKPDFAATKKFLGIKDKEQNDERA